MAATSRDTGDRPRSAQRPAAQGERRADARRNIQAILDAAQLCLARDADASVADIAKAAGVGRVTLYGHFGTRADLVDAVLTRTVEQADAVLDATDTTGDPSQALARLVGASWQIVHQFRSVLQAAQRELPAERIRAVHDRILHRVQTIIDRGQRAGAFRDDLPKRWLVTTAFSLMHAAAEDSAAGRLDADDAARVISVTLLAALAAPGAAAATSTP
ncbi:TetR/AcrR family transcriptional regulator [Microbispora sp. RL4-1S]|uniref:TetR/AcrR family transcriptional regulator n=1 Tax=Microbispora oryzae TaxID=2806554 RepID=A0A941ASA8_9ACTN|nr:TetR/AcrR family transcriptional regulator [Microbispora oryzae]MBP2707804.1 TetR/AcrR family transcriptional regulator [Microbispora oryzae]